MRGGNIAVVAVDVVVEEVHVVYFDPVQTPQQEVGLTLSVYQFMPHRHLNHPQKGNHDGHAHQVDPVPEGGLKQ